MQPPDQMCIFPPSILVNPFQPTCLHLHSCTSLPPWLRNLFSATTLTPMVSSFFRGDGPASSPFSQFYLFHPSTPQKQMSHFNTLFALHFSKLCLSPLFQVFQVLSFFSPSVVSLMFPLPISLFSPLLFVLT